MTTTMDGAGSVNRGIGALLCLTFSFIMVMAGVVQANPESGYVITTSKYFMANTTETVCIQLVSLSADVTVQLVTVRGSDVVYPPLAEAETEGAARGHVCLTLFVPPLSTTTKAVLTAQISGTTTSGEPFSDSSQKQVELMFQRMETFIQTDKPIYKAGQVVKIRLLSLMYPSMKPYTNQYSEIYITTPDDIRVRQWRNVDTQEGLIDLAMQLSGDPVLGTWSIHATVDGITTRQTFKIDEYVLPKFDVVITAPPYIHNRETNVEFTVCGLYTYGQPVRGAIKANISLTANVPQLTRTTEDTGDDGCHTFVFPLSHFGTSTAITGSFLHLDVNFTETATGVSRTETHGTTQVFNSPFTLEVMGSDEFKPGLPHRFQILSKEPVGQTPAPYKDVTITVTDNNNLNFRVTQTATTDQSGKANIEFETPVNPFVTELAINLQWSSDDGQRVTATKTIYAWYSPSGSFVAVRPLTSKYEVDESINAQVEFIIPETESEEMIEFIYYVFANRNLISSGTHTWSHGLSNDNTRVSRQTDTLRQGNPTRSGSRTTDPPNLEPYPDAIRALTSISIPVTSKMAPAATVVVYFARQDGEVVSAKQNFKVQLAFENDVSLDFDVGQVFPGSEVSLNIHASPGSLCAIGSVDKSILLLEDSDGITQEKIFTPLNGFEISTSGRNATCPDVEHSISKRRSGRPGFSGPRFMPYRPRPTTRTWSNSKHFDAISAFQSSGIEVLSNFVLETRPCYRYTETYQQMYDHRYHYSFGVGMRGPSGPSGPRPEIRPMFADDMFVMSKAQPTGPIYQLRTYFPETWLWHLSRIGDGGVTSVNHHVPHSITDWVTTGFCTSAQDGVGVAKPISLRVFQPFFISTTLPYSVIRDEEFPLKITVFNYLSQCFTVAVRISPTSDYSIRSDTFSRFVCVCGNQAESVDFDIIPRRLGEIPITVMGEYVAPSLDLPPCGSSTMIMTDLLDVWDAVNKTVIVEAEGSEVERTNSFLVCPDATADGTSFLKEVTFDFPFNTIPGTGSCKVQITGNVLGPVLTNLGSLLRMPCGCGEQNMIGFTPNIFVLMYLDRTNQQGILPDVYNQAKEYMEIGYERELKYRLSDGSYSAFGERDGEGSTWLTAFVLKSFALAAEFIDIDSNDLRITKEWLLSEDTLDQTNGCFIQRGRVIHKSMQGGHSSEVTLTAYVTIALLDAGEPTTSMVMLRSVLCLAQALTGGLDDSYSLAMVTYALAKAENPFYVLGLQKLNERAINGDGTRHWVRTNAPSCNGGDSCKADPAEIEMTAYVLLTYLKVSQGDPQLLLDARLIVEWLNEQRNSHGGFTSTQDTVIGLEALASYAERVHSDNKNVLVDISTTQGNLQQEHCQFTNENELVMTEFEIRQCPNTLRIFGEGEGCVLFQAVTQFHLPVQRLTLQYFNVQVGVRDLTPRQDCTRIYLDVTVSYIDPNGDATNMAVVDVKMVSGYSVDTAELDNYMLYLQSIGRDIGLMRYDHYENGKPFSLYFNQFSSEPISFVLVLKRDIHVKNTRDAYIKVYDYYEGGVVTYKSYHPCQQS